MLTKNTCPRSNVGNRRMSCGGGAGEGSSACGGSAAEHGEKQDVQRLPERHRNTFIPFRCNPFISFLTQPIDFFENEAKQVELGTALGPRTGCENLLKD